MKSSEVNKIKKDLLAASEQTKARVCRDIRNNVFPDKYFCYTDAQKRHFLHLCDAADFEAAVAYLVDTMLPYLKKADSSWFITQLVHIKVEMVTIIDYNARFQKFTDEAVAESHVKYLLLGFKKLQNKKQLHAGDLLYLLQELSKLPVSDEVKTQKYCTFHLLAQILRTRTTGRFIESSVYDAFLYFQEKYHCFDEGDTKDMAMFNMEFRKDTFKEEWDKYQNPEKASSKVRTTIDDISRMLGEMDQAHAELVHYLFMCNYIDYSRYSFRDGWMIDRYVSVYNAYFQESPVYLREVNGYVLEILKEWQQDANHKYQKAKKDLFWWMTDPIPPFKPSLGDEIEAAWQKVSDAEDEKEIAAALLPFPIRIFEQVQSGQYEDAAANVYCILEHLAIANNAHEDWFDCWWNGGEQTDVVSLVEVLQELYSHMRQLKDLPVNLKNEMDIHLDIFNKKTSFFGMDYGDSRYEDMLLDGKEQDGDYSDLSQCYMWSDWYLPKVSGEPLHNPEAN